MAAPTTRFRLIPNNTTVIAVDDATTRLAAIAGQAVKSTGAGNEADFGTVDISAGAANSGVLTLLWDVTADGGNTEASDFRLWVSTIDFTEVASVIKVQPLSGADQVAASTTANYITEATVASYTWATMAESLPGAQNVYPSDEGASMVLSTASDDVVMWAMYAAIAASEVTGTYSGTTASYGLQFSFRYSYN